MSPEQARDLAEVDQRSDQFSFGLVLYELATGHRAFERSSPAELMTAIIRAPGPLPAVIPGSARGAGWDRINERFRKHVCRPDPSYT
jgi:hypothetical protein